MIGSTQRATNLTKKYNTISFFNNVSGISYHTMTAHSFQKSCIDWTKMRSISGKKFIIDAHKMILHSIRGLLGMMD